MLIDINENRQLKQYCVTPYFHDDVYKKFKNCNSYRLENLCQTVNDALANWKDTVH